MLCINIQAPTRATSVCTTSSTSSSNHYKRLTPSGTLDSRGGGWGGFVADSAYFMPFLIVYYCDTQRRHRCWGQLKGRDGFFSGSLGAKEFQLPKQQQQQQKQNHLNAWEHLLACFTRHKLKFINILCTTCVNVCTSTSALCGPLSWSRRSPLRVPLPPRFPLPLHQLQAASCSCIREQLSSERQRHIFSHQPKEANNKKNKNKNKLHIKQLKATNECSNIYAPKGITLTYKYFLMCHAFKGVAYDLWLCLSMWKLSCDLTASPDDLALRQRMMELYRCGVPRPLIDCCSK